MLSDFSRYFKFKKSRYLYSESTIKYSVFSIQFCGFDLCFNISVWCLGMLSCLLLINLVSFHWYLASFRFLQFFNYSSSFETSPGVVYFCMCMKILRSVLHPRVLLTATNITYSQPLRAQLHPHIKDTHIQFHCWQQRGQNSICSSRIQKEGHLKKMSQGSCYAK